MKNGYVVLGIIALLFVSMYGFAYFSVAREKFKAKRERKQDKINQELRRLESVRKQEVIDEKVRKFNERKEEIHKELMLLEKMKEKQQVV